MLESEDEKRQYYFSTGIEPEESYNKDELDEFFEFSGDECDMIVSGLNSEAVFVSRLLGLVDFGKGKVPVARVVHNRKGDDADFFSYAVLVPYGMNLVWEVFPILSHSKVSMPEALIMPYLNHLLEQGKIDFRETRFRSEDEFVAYVKERERQFDRWDNWWMEHQDHDIRFAKDDEEGKGLYCYDCNDWR